MTEILTDEELEYILGLAQNSKSHASEIDLNYDNHVLLVAAREHFPRLISAYRKQQSALDAAREALEAVEWHRRVCPWCHASDLSGHDINCPRQSALAKLREEPHP